MADGACDQTKTQMEIEQFQMQEFEHDAHENVYDGAPMTSQRAESKPGVYHKDPTSPQPYRMDRRKYNKIICENLQMNENLITTPDDEKYHGALRTATQDLSSVNETHRIKDWDAMVSPTKYKAFKNCEPGRHGAPYDYRKYLPEAE